jgi:hypothetical protein
MRLTRSTLFSVLVFCAAIRGTAGDPGARCWLLIDFDAVSCSLCREPLLDFCRALPAVVQEERVLAVVVFAAASDPEAADRRRRVVAAQWEGFRRAHGLRFPAVLDDGPVFRRWLENGAARILLFDGRARVVREIGLPAPPGRLDEALALLLN